MLTDMWPGLAKLPHKWWGAKDGACAKINTIIRCRPLNSKERGSGTGIALSCPTSSSLVLRNGGVERSFSLDHVFDGEVTQEEFFHAVGLPLCERAIEGYNVTILAYGSAGSGKSYTMLGHGDAPEDMGLIPRIGMFLLELRAQFSLQCSFIEVHNEVIYDLLASNKDRRRCGPHRGQGELGPCIRDFVELLVEDLDGLSGLIREGLGQRTSSRSHCILTIRLSPLSIDFDARWTSVFTFVDLAGSERAKGAKSEKGEELKEEASINKSLSALSNVLVALSSMSASSGSNAFVPFRDSKLTRALYEALEARALCTTIGTVSPSSLAVDETLATLNFVRRTKSARIIAPAHPKRMDTEERKRPNSVESERSDDKLEARLREIEARVVAAEELALAAREGRSLGASFLQSDCHLSASPKLAADTRSQTTDRLTEPTSDSGQTGPWCSMCNKVQVASDKPARDLAEVLQELTALRARESELLEMLCDRDRAYSDLSAQLQEKTLEHESAQRRLSEASQVHGQLQTLQATTNDWIQRCEDLRSEVKTLKSGSKLLAKQNQKLVERIEHHKRKREDLVKRLEASEEARRAARDRCERMLQRHLGPNESQSQPGLFTCDGMGDPSSYIDDSPKGSDAESGSDNLPEGWAAYDDGQGNTYFACVATGESSWERPSKSHHPCVKRSEKSSPE